MDFELDLQTNLDKFDEEFNIILSQFLVNIFLSKKYLIKIKRIFEKKKENISDNLSFQIESEHKIFKFKDKLKSFINCSIAFYQKINLLIKQFFFENNEEDNNISLNNSSEVNINVSSRNSINSYNNKLIQGRSHLDIYSDNDNEDLNIIEKEIISINSVLNFNENNSKNNINIINYNSGETWYDNCKKNNNEIIINNINNNITNNIDKNLANSLCGFEPKNNINGDDTEIINSNINSYITNNIDTKLINSLYTFEPKNNINEEEINNSENLLLFFDENSSIDNEKKSIREKVNNFIQKINLSIIKEDEENDYEYEEDMK